jgi:ribosome-associated protein
VKTDTKKKKKAPAKRTNAKGGAPRRKSGTKKGPSSKNRAQRRKEALATGAKQRPATAENPEAKALAHKIGRAVLDKKALDVVVLDVRGIASYADYVVIASGESDRQVAAMAEGATQKLKAEDNLATIGSEGMETGQWVLLDYGDVVAHLFHADVRSHYDLEGLWADAPRETVA